VVDTVEQPEQEIQQTEPKPQSEVIRVKPEPRASSGAFFVIVILMLIFLLAGVGFYFFTQLRAKQEGLGGEVKSELTKQIGDYQSQLTAIQSQLSALQSEISGKDDRINKTLNDFSDLQGQKLEVTRKELSDKVLQVQRQLGKTRGDWLVADAEYLLSVANERLHLSGDVGTTLAALEAADQRLRESGDSGVIKIREQIAREIALLQGIKQADIVGIFSTLQALESDIGKLNLLLPYSGKPDKEPQATTESSKVGEDHDSLLNSAIEELEGIVTIKHADIPVKEILTKEQAEFIREQLKVKLEIIKLALAQQNDDLFQAGLTDSKVWLEQHFAKTEESGRFTEELVRLQALKLRSQYPDISQSLKMLRDVGKLRLENDKLIESNSQNNPDKDNPPETKATTNAEENKPQTEPPPLDSSAAPQPKPVTQGK
jgi:uroporphyrin-III C-methyltransferase